MSRNIEFSNGKKIEDGLSDVNSLNRSFLYGDGLFETIRVFNGIPLFLNHHIDRMQFGMDRLMMEPPMEGFEKHMAAFIPKILSDENVVHGRIRLTIYRDSSGLYTPTELQSGWHLTIKELALEEAETIDHVKAVVFSGMRKDNSWVSRIKTTSSLLYVMAGIHAVSCNKDESIILNSEGRIVESHTSNIFICNGGTFQTPPLSEGCIDGVLRRQIIGVMNRNGINVRETPITKADLISADEILLTNVMSWCRNVIEFEGKTFATDTAEMLNQVLMDQIQ
jgi:branched-chain amino acid aminotransferase